MDRCRRRCSAVRRAGSSIRGLDLESSHGLMTARPALGYLRPMPGSTIAARRTRAAAALADRDLRIALVLALLALVQVLFLLPIAPRAIGAVIALGSTLPIAWRRSHPVAAALAGAAPWLIPSEGFILVGYVAAFCLFYGVTAYTPDLHVAGATVLVGVIIGVAGTAIQHLGIGDYAGAVIAVVAPAGVGLLVRRQ